MSEGRECQWLFGPFPFSLPALDPLGSHECGSSRESGINFFFFTPTCGLGYQRDECKRIKQYTPFNDGPLGSRNDEERGKMRKCSMNCRIWWIIDSLNAHCTEASLMLWYARLSLYYLPQHPLLKNREWTMGVGVSYDSIASRSSKLVYCSEPGNKTGSVRGVERVTFC